MDTLKDKIIKFSLQNSIKYDGKPSVGSIVGLMIADDPSLKKDVKGLQEKINEVFEELSKLSLDEQIEKLKKLAPRMLEKKKSEKREGLKPLPKAEKGLVVMRFEPSPSGPLHIGHSFVMGLTHEYCKMYDGKFILRIADTNASNIYEPAYELIPRDANWLTNGNVNEIVIQSERMPIYYDHMNQLFEKDAAYVCTCPQDEFKQMIDKKIACSCRDNSKETNLELWKEMATTIEEGGAVVRLKTDVTHKNPAMRDFPLFRINDEPHPKTGNQYRVWPLMNFAVAIDDFTTGVTHSIRAKEHFDNEKRQAYIYDYLGWEKPTCLYVGRINFTDLRVSCSKTRPLIESGEYTGWDDIRLPFLPALRRRGYSPESLLEYAKSVGITLNDKTVSGEEFFKTIDAFDKQFRDERTKRMFFVNNPVKIEIKNAPDQNIELDLHPDNMKGGRKFKVKDKFFITQEDLDSIKTMKNGHMIRLMDCLNFIKKGDEFIFDSVEYEKYMAASHKKIIHWLPVDNVIDVKVLMPDAKEIEGKMETYSLEVGEVIQFERFGFARKDSEGYFWYLHK